MNKNRFAGLADAKLKALEPEPEESIETETTPQKAQKPSPKQTSKQANKQTGKLVIKDTGSQENLVGVTIKIPESKRIWWNVQAKLQRTTVTDAIIEALDKRFGEPNF